MSRKLIVTTATALTLCAASFGLAIMIGGDDIFHDARTLQGVKPLLDLATHKTWRWDGGDTLALDAPINIRYQPNGPPQVSVTGPEELLKHVRVGDGRIGADAGAMRRGGKKLDAVVSGVEIRKFVINSGENLDLGRIDQQDLNLHINGSGTVKGEGRLGRLSLVIAGPGRAELGRLSTGDAKISILGNGTAALSPHGDVQLFIAGNGTLDLMTRPAHLRQTILGNGDVRQISNPPPPPERAEPPLPPTPPPVPQTASAQSVGNNVTVTTRSNMDLGRIEQESLNVTITASGSLTAEGKVDTLKLQVLGSGQAWLGKLMARRVQVMVAGSGSATIAPSEELRATIMGSGNVRLTTRPARIERSILGSGRIIEDF
ncbi:MAG TPA: DUF2807 domain-containing protein [Rhizomicrobium sp.]|nr:DUF2807 domain-containing protein [Rhizomicrobium sp.]